MGRRAKGPWHERVANWFGPPPIAAAMTRRRWSSSFLDYLRSECHLAENTVHAYRRDLRRFCTWLGHRHIPKLTIRQLSDYAGWLHDEGLAPPSVARHLASLKVFFRYLQLEGILQGNLAELLGTQRLWQRVPRALSPHIVNRFLAAPAARDAYGIRDRALLELMYATGCRASEISDLKSATCTYTSAFCICHGKGDKQRLVPLHEPAIAAIERVHSRAATAIGRAGLACSGLAAAVVPRTAFAAGGNLGAGQEVCGAGRRVRTPSVRTR